MDDDVGVDDDVDVEDVLGSTVVVVGGAVVVLVTDETGVGAVMDVPLEPSLSSEAQPVASRAASAAAIGDRAVRGRGTRPRTLTGRAEGRPPPSRSCGSR